MVWNAKKNEPEYVRQRFHMFWIGFLWCMFRLQFMEGSLLL